MYTVQGAPIVGQTYPSYRSQVGTPLSGSVPYVETLPTSVPYQGIGTPITMTSNIGYAATPPMVAYGTTEEPKVFTARLSHALFRRCACEFFGTLLLFLVVVLCSNALYIAAFYTALVYALWFVSGAHLNPAISLALFLARKMPFGACLAYIIAQIAGASAGGLLYRLIFPVGGAITATTATTTATVTAAATYTLADACCIQTLYTTMLAFVALNVMVSHRYDGNQFYGIALGSVIVAGGYVGLVVSGDALFNPAFCLGLLVSSKEVGSFGWYILAEAIGAVLAVLLFELCRFQDERIRQVSYDFYEIEEGANSPTSPTMVSVENPYQIIRAFSEFVGTFWLVITILLNTAFDTGYTALSGAGVLISLIYALGGVSGGHFNPAVTLAMLWGGRNKCSGRNAVWYIIAQLLSSIPAGILASSIKVTGLFAFTSHDWFSVVFGEFIFTLMLAYVVLEVATSEQHTNYGSSSPPNFYFALAIGLIFVGGSYALGNVSGGYLNPAVALGFSVDAVDITSKATIEGWPSYMDVFLKALSVIGQGIVYFGRDLVYWIAEVLGAAVAALLFRRLHREAFQFTKEVY